MHMEESSADCIEKQIELKAPVARVWRALTDHKEFGEWFRVNLETPFVPGETTRGNITYPGCEHLVMEVVVDTMEPERLFSFRWHPKPLTQRWIIRVSHQRSSSSSSNRWVTERCCSSGSPASTRFRQGGVTKHIGGTMMAGVSK